MSTIWNLFFYQPTYNLLIVLINKVTLGDIGLAIILITIIVKLILFPLTRKSIKTQIMMKRMQPELEKIKNDFPDREEQAKKTFELYKKYDTNPFSGFLLIFIQFPVLIALYRVFYNGFTAASYKSLYSFVQIPTILNSNFLGFIDLYHKSIILALLAGVSQFVQAYLASPIESKPSTPNTNKKFADELASSMQTNMKYTLPVIITLITYNISAALALYIAISNIFTIAQEWYVKSKLEIKAQ